MANKNYNKMSKPKPETVKPEVVEQPVEKVTEEVVKEPVVKDVIGIVVDCVRLNIRQNPNKEAKVLFTVDVDSELTIDLNKSTDGWYRITASNGRKGYCMKDYVKVKA